MKKTWLRKRVVVVIAPLVIVGFLLGGCIPQAGRRVSAYPMTPAEEAQAYCESVVKRPNNTRLRTELGMAAFSGTSAFGPVSPLIGIISAVGGATILNSTGKNENAYIEEFERCMQQEMNSGKYARY